MKKRRFLAVFALCLIFIMLSGTSTIYAQSPSTIGVSSYAIKSNDGSDMTSGPLMAGDTYTVSFEVTIDVDLANTTLNLQTPMEKVGDVYWYLDNDYPGVNTDTWQPGRDNIDFNAVKGTAKFRVKGSIPSDYTWETLSVEEWTGDEILHFAKPISLMTLSLGTDVLDNRSVEVTDQTIDSYRQSLVEKENLLQTTDIDTKYRELVEGVIARAESLREDGFVQKARNLLGTIPGSISGFPTQVSEKSILPYLIIIIVLAIILIAFFALYLKARSNSGFIRQQVDEEAGRLDVLLVRASKIDRQLAGDIEQVKEQLEKLAGR